MPKSVMIKSKKLETDIPPVDPTDDSYSKIFDELTQKTFKRFELKDRDNYPQK